MKILSFRRKKKVVHCTNTALSIGRCGAWCCRHLRAISSDVTNKPCFHRLTSVTGISFRGLFIIDDKGNLRQITVNDLPVGRSVDETLRLVQAFQFTDKHGEVCPAGWRPGDSSMKPDPKGSKSYFQNQNWLRYDHPTYIDIGNEMPHLNLHLFGAVLLSN